MVPFPCLWKLFISYTSISIIYVMSSAVTYNMTVWWTCLRFGMENQYRLHAKAVRTIAYPGAVQKMKVYNNWDRLEYINISYYMVSYHIISYQIISYHIISYQIISYIIYHIISYHIISYPISYHIIPYQLHDVVLVIYNSVRDTT